MEQFAPLQYARPLTRIFLFFSLLLMSMMFGAMVGGLIAEKFFYFVMGGDTETLLKDAAENADALRGLKVVQLSAQVFGLLMPSLFFARLVRVDVGEELNLYNKALPLSYLLLAIAMIVLIPFINFTAWLNNSIDFPTLLGEAGKIMKEQEEQNGKLTELFLDMPTFKSFLFMVVVVGIMPALAEEFVFRGVFQKTLTNLFKNVHLGVWFAAIVFSASHFQFYGFVPRMLMGAVLGYAFAYSRTIWVPVVGHAVNNTFGVIARYLGWDKSESALNPDTIGVGTSEIISAIVSLAIGGGLMYLLAKKEVADKSQPTYEETPQLPPPPTQ